MARSNPPRDMPIEDALSVAIVQLGQAIDQLKCWCVFDQPRKRELTVQQQAARRKYDELLAARIVLIQQRAELKRARVLTAVRLGSPNPAGAEKKGEK